MKHVFFLCIAVVFLGCSDEPVRSAKVPKQPDNTPRTIAVMVPRSDATWFFKLSGPAAAVATEEPAFRKWVESVKFQAAEPPVSWTAPEGWSKGDERSERFATLRTGSGIEATVVKLGPKQDLLENVNRWRSQIGLAKASNTKEIEKSIGAIRVGDTDATIVDIANPEAAPVALKPSKPATMKETFAVPVEKLTYQTPSGWEVVPASGMRAAAFKAGSGDEAAEITIIPLGGLSGGMTANVNRWRTQIKLPQQDEAAIKASAKELMIDGESTQYFDLLGPEGDKRQRILAVIAERGDRTWFIKMQGPAETVARNQSAFESFARSLRFPSGAK